MATDWNKLASDVIELVGGEENITSITHCVTRLRFMLKDESKADDEQIGKLNGVIQVMHASGQYQVVIGPKVGGLRRGRGAAARPCRRRGRGRRRRAGGEGRL